MELRRLEGEELERTLAELVRAIVASLDPELPGSHRPPKRSITSTQVAW